jgi:hypothetical protein
VSNDKLVCVLDGDWRFMPFGPRSEELVSLFSLPGRGQSNDEYTGAIFRWPSKACFTLLCPAMGTLVEDCLPNGLACDNRGGSLLFGLGLMMVLLGSW